MDWKPIENSEFNDILDLLDVSFPICREIIDQDLQEVIDDPTPHGKIYRLKVDGNQIVGTAIYGRLYGTPKSHPGDVWEGEGILRYLAIHPDHRRKGYATWIINKVMSDLKDVGCPCLCISIWRHADDVYRNLYKRFGFEYYDSSISERYGEYFGEQDYYVYWFPTGEKNKK